MIEGGDHCERRRAIGNKALQKSYFTRTNLPADLFVIPLSLLQMRMAEMFLSLKLNN